MPSRYTYIQIHTFKENKGLLATEGGLQNEVEVCCERKLLTKIQNKLDPSCCCC